MASNKSNHLALSIVFIVVAAALAVTGYTQDGWIRWVAVVGAAASAIAGISFLVQSQRSIKK
jgi:uncharacterized membrane protein YfcA